MEKINNDARERERGGRGEWTRNPVTKRTVRKLLREEGE